MRLQAYVIRAVLYDDDKKIVRAAKRDMKKQLKYVVKEAGKKTIRGTWVFKTSKDECDEFTTAYMRVSAKNGKKVKG